MKSVNLMMEEHQNILHMVEVIRMACYEILKGNDIPYDDFKDMIDYVRNYADTHHHGKEEDIMFRYMKEELGKMGENLITHGMLVEHDQGRLYMKQLEEALENVKSNGDIYKLDVIANAISYTHLIVRHIKKEDELIYPYGENNLAKATLELIEVKTDAFEENAKNKGIQEYYQNMLNRLQQKYC